MNGFSRGRARRFPAWASSLAITAIAALGLAAPAGAGAKTKNCCFATSVAVFGGYSTQYGSNPVHPYTGRYGASWTWATRELVAYKHGELRDLGSKVIVDYYEEWDVSKHRFGTDADQDPVPCEATSFTTPTNRMGLHFIDSAATRLGLSETPAGKPAIEVGLGGPYAQVGPNCTLGEEGDHAGEFNLDPWSFTVPGPPAKFLRTASRGDVFWPHDFNGGTLTYSHPYEDAGVVSPHAFTGQSTVSVRLKYFPKSDLDAQGKQLKRCEHIGEGTCGTLEYPHSPVTDQDLSGVPAANP